jgi:hypothetical protein
MLGDERGMTLTELIIVSFLMLFVLAAIYSIFGTSQGIYDTIEGQNAATGDASRAMFQLTKECREMIDLQSTYPGGYTGTPGPYRLSMRTDYDDDGEFENVMFFVSSRRIYRYTNEPNSTTVRSEIIARDVRNSERGIPLFTFLNASSQVITDTAQYPSKTYSIRIEVVTDQWPTKPPAALRLVTTVYRRNSPSG